MSRAQLRVDALHALEEISFKKFTLVMILRERDMAAVLNSANSEKECLTTQLSTINKVPIAINYAGAHDA